MKRTAPHLVGALSLVINGSGPYSILLAPPQTTQGCSSPRPRLEKLTQAGPCSFLLFSWVKRSFVHSASVKSLEAFIPQSNCHAELPEEKKNTFVLISLFSKKCKKKHVTGVASQTTQGQKLDTLTCAQNATH